MNWGFRFIENIGSLAYRREPVEHAHALDFDNALSLNTGRTDLSDERVSRPVTTPRPAGKFYTAC